MTERDWFLRRLERDALVACAAMAALALAWPGGGGSMAVAVAGGGLIAAASYRAIKGGVDAVSGGGTRAAAFSYGVLEELQRTEIVVDGQPRRLIDEVDMITGVSGGSFTALAYALNGDRLFSEYEDRFLKRDVQGALTERALNPLNWPEYLGGSAGRSELAWIPTAGDRTNTWGRGRWAPVDLRQR